MGTHVLGRPLRFSRLPASGVAGLAWIGAGLASLAASAVAAVLAVVFAASVLLIALTGVGLLAFLSLSARARRPVRVRAGDEPQILEARNIGGHSWVAYGWDRPAR